MWFDRVRNVLVNKQEKQGFNAVEKVENMGDALGFQYSHCLLQFFINCAIETIPFVEQPLRHPPYLVLRPYHPLCKLSLKQTNPTQATRTD
jgi:hypothetical protein